VITKNLVCFGESFVGVTKNRLLGTASEEKGTTTEKGFIVCVVVVGDQPSQSGGQPLLSAGPPQKGLDVFCSDTSHLRLLLSQGQGSYRATSRHASPHMAGATTKHQATNTITALHPGLDQYSTNESSEPVERQALDVWRQGSGTLCAQL